MTRFQPPVTAAARAANALFFIVTATYCILTYSSFAYQQFIRPRLVSSLAGFVAFHHLWHWVMLGITVMTLLPEWKSSRGRVVAWAYVAAMAAVGLVLLYRPVLPSVENDGAGLWLAFLFLLPPVWLAAYDHLATARRVDLRVVDVTRVVVSMAITGLFVWAFNAASVPLHFSDLGDYTASGEALLFGALVSLAVHVGLFTTGGVLLGLLLQAVSTRRAAAPAQYWLIAAAAWLVTTVTTGELVFGALSFHGVASWLLAGEAALALTLTWSAVARRHVTASQTIPDALRAWTAPVAGIRRGVALVALAAVPLVQHILLRRVETFDWNFLVQNLCVSAAWIVAPMLVHSVVGERGAAGPSRPVAIGALAIVAVAGVGAGGTIESTLPGSQQFVPEFVLDAYATVDPSYRLTRQLLASEPAGSRAFFAQLTAHSLIQHVDVAPVDISFVRPLTPAPAPPPHLFLFVIDSLRRDYLSPYNPTVRFTPAIEQFSRESVTFRRAFTRYGGTGLSMPAIWAGSMLLHKEYVQPFQPMNALEKLVVANHYRAVMSMDHITRQMVSPALHVDPLDAGRDEMQYDFCTTLDEIEGRLNAGLADRGPVFAHTRSLNLHISKLTTRVGAPDASFGEFQGPAAAAIQRMDACFGRFIETLKARRLYDDSIVVLTADHGDALGEARRWGHAYTLFPEIVRTPLLIHVPAGLRARLPADEDAVSFSTDITPSLYALLGYAVPPQEWPLGRPLFVPPGADTSWRRQPALLASSYGPVYGVLRDNGESLYIADAVNGRDYAYNLRALKPVRIGVTAAMRADNRAFVSEKLEYLASLYHFTPHP